MVVNVVRVVLIACTEFGGPTHVGERGEIGGGDGRGDRFEIGISVNVPLGAGIPCTAMVGLTTFAYCNGGNPCRLLESHRQACVLGINSIEVKGGGTRAFRASP